MKAVLNEYRYELLNILWDISHIVVMDIWCKVYNVLMSRKVLVIMDIKEHINELIHKL